MKLEQISKYMERAGVPGEDPRDCPTSLKRFTDGGWYRHELSAIEHVAVLEAMLDESKKRKTPIHRVNAFFQGGVLYDEGEIRAYAQLADEEGIEVMACPGPRVWWDIGRQTVTTEGARCGNYARGSNEIRKIIADLFRLYECGIRGFLLIDDGLLDLLHTMQELGDFPRDVALKISASASPNHPSAARLMEKLGASTINPGSDLTLPILAGLRSSVDIPMDIYLFTPLSMGGINRMYDAHELARVCAPVYFRMDPAPELTYGFNQPWASDEQYIQLARKKVKYAQIVDALIAENAPEISPSPLRRPRQISAAAKTS